MSSSSHMRQSETRDNSTATYGDRERKLTVYFETDVQPYIRVMHGRSDTRHFSSSTNRQNFDIPLSRSSILRILLRISHILFRGVCGPRIKWSILRISSLCESCERIWPSPQSRRAFRILYIRCLIQKDHSNVYDEEKNSILHIQICWMTTRLSMNNPTGPHRFSFSFFFFFYIYFHNVFCAAQCFRNNEIVKKITTKRSRSLPQDFSRTDSIIVCKIDIWITYTVAIPRDMYSESNCCSKFFKYRWFENCFSKMNINCVRKLRWENVRRIVIIPS